MTVHIIRLITPHLEALYIGAGDVVEERAQALEFATREDAEARLARAGRLWRMRAAVHSGSAGAHDWPSLPVTRAEAYREWRAAQERRTT